MEKNRVLLITSEFPPQPGGIGNHALHLAKGLNQHQYPVSVVSDIRSGLGAEEREFDRSLPFPVFRIKRRRIPIFSYLKRIRAAFTQARSHDFIFCSGKFSLWTGALLSFFYKKKFIAVVHGSELNSPNRFLKHTVIFSLKRFREIIAVSAFTKSLLPHFLQDKTTVIHNGFKVSVPEVCAVKTDPAPVLTTVGRLCRRKGQHNVIAALPELLAAYPDLKYYMVGIPEDQNALRHMAMQLKVEQAPRFFGRLSEDEKVQILLQTDIFIMLSEPTASGDVEGFGIAVLEAAALGIPTIGSRGCGLEEAVSDGFSGILIDPHKPEELKNAIEEILDSYDRFSHQAQQWSENFTWEKVIFHYLNLIHKSG